MGRIGFLDNLISRAKESGHSVYEELQGGSTIKSAVADWNEIVKDTAKGVKEDVDKIAAWVSPTIDATPGRHTLEDTIDNFIFDPTSNLAPLELIGLGAASGSKAAMAGTMAAAKKVGFKIDDVIQQSSKLRKAAMVVKNPRVAVEGAVRRKGFALQDDAANEFLDIFKLTTEAKPGLKGELMEMFPEIRKTAENWDDFAVQMWKQDPKAAEVFMTKSGRARKKVGQGLERGIEVVEDIFPKGAQPGGGTIEGDLIKSPIFAAVGAREKARKLADDKKKENDFWKVGGSR